jgi:hypothetical protein
MAMPILFTGHTEVKWVKLIYIYILVLDQKGTMQTTMDVLITAQCGPVWGEGGGLEIACKS